MEALSGKSNLYSATADEKVKEQLFSLENRLAEMAQSMRYAGRLQQAILPNEVLFQEAFNDAFVMYQPKDLVSGDFYWIYTFQNQLYIAVGDCTGHGVPGALINIAGNSILRQIIKQDGISNPAEIMIHLDAELSNLFNENLTEGTTPDGMDIVLCKFDYETMIGEFCGAGRPLIQIRQGALIEFRKGKSSIGYDPLHKKHFESIHFDIEKGDLFYLFSDGYTDQFGGDNIKKFNRKRFRQLLLSVSEMKMTRQKEELELTFSNWRGDQEQIDDVTLMGIRI